jgi:hypothetical protein
MTLRQPAARRSQSAFGGLMLPVVFQLAFVGAGGAQVVALPAVDLPDSLVSEEMLSELPQPSAAALEVEEVDLWSTGVSPTGAVLATPLFPGWGQLYSDNTWKAALAYGTEMYFWTNILSRDRQAVRARDRGRN